MAATLADADTEPPSRLATPNLRSKLSDVLNTHPGSTNSLVIPASRTSTPPPPPSKPIPTDFKSSLNAWWNNSSYKEARIAEERLLRRMTHYNPPAPTPSGQGKTWLPWSNGAESSVIENVVPPAATENGLVATLRNVFITTPNPALAPAHPADVHVPSSSTSPSANSSSCSVNNSHKIHSHSLKRQSNKLVDYINTLEISRPDDANSKEAVVVLHGYAAALGFFFRNWEAISEAGAQTHRRTFFLDWLGMGLSSRPSPQLLASPSNAPLANRVARAEHFFLSSLESWRESVGVDKMILVGHSLGGYLASAYAVRYPDRVSSLILLSPAGIPHAPEDKYKPSGREPSGPGAKEYKDGKTGQRAEPSAKAVSEGREEAAEAAETELEGGPKGEAKQWRENNERSAFRRTASKVFIWGWEKGLSPFSILRGIGPWGPLLVGRYSSRRFAAQTEQDVRDLHTYIYNTSVLKGSGEYCISHLLQPGAFARIPIIDRIDRLKIPVTFLYGDNDWMDVEGGHQSVKILKNAGNDQGSCHIVPGAGHHVYLDNPEVTNKIVADAIASVPHP